MMRSCNCDTIEDKFKHTVEMLRVLTDGIDEIIYVVDPDNYKILFANSKTEKLFGKKILGKKCYKIFQNSKRPCSFCTNKHLFKERSEKTHSRGLQNQRNKRWYRCMDKAIKWSGDRYVRFGIAIDVTEQKKMEEALRESERRYRNLVETAPAVIYTLSVDGTIASLNPQFEKTTGWSRSEWLRKSFAPIVHPDDLPLATETFKRVLRGETVPPYELRVLSKSGKYLVGEFTSIPITDDGKVVGEFGVVQNVTERKRMESALREREELFRSVVENSHNCILIVDDNFKIIYANDEAACLGGYPKKEIIGHDFRKFLDQNSKSFVKDRYIRRQKGENVPRQYEFKILRKDGEKRDVEIKSAVVKDIEGKTRSVVQLIDISERKKIENERNRFEERLSALNVYGQSLSMTKSMEEIYKLTIEAMEKTLGFEYASILMVEGKKLCLVAIRGYSKKLSLKLPLDGDKGVTTRVARIGKPVFVPDIRKEKAYVKGGKNICSELAVPIKVGKKVLGVLNVESQKLAAFGKEDRKLLEILGSYAAIAISNLKKREKLSALNEYGRSLNRVENSKQIHALTLNAMEKTLGFEFATFFIVEGKRLRLVSHRGYPKKLSILLPLDGDVGIGVKAARTGKPIFVPNIRKEKAYVEGIPGMLSELAVPIKVGSKVLGVLNVESERLAAFDEEDMQLLEILASHAATAISNLERRKNMKVISRKIKDLMKSSTEIMQVKDMKKRLEVIAKTVQKTGWRRIVISLRDENLEGTELVTAGLTEEETKLLLERKAPGSIWRERLGPKFERFRVGEFYYLPWIDPWIRQEVHGVPPDAPLDEATTYAGVPSRLSEEEMVDWHPQDMIYAPLRTPDGRIVGILSMDDPLDGRKPSRESLTPLELFLHQAAITIENAQLIESLREARKQLEEYAGRLEQKVEDRTRELRKSQEQLLKAQRLAVIGELAGMVGHDLRNPLTSISGAQYYLKKRFRSEPNDKIKEMLELMEKNIAYSNKIINDLLDYSREIELEITESSLKPIVKEALFLVEIPKNVRVIDLTEKKPKIKIDVEKIKRAFVNIIKNAVEAMPRGGTLTIKSRTTDSDLEITFSDTGTGISKEKLEKLWTPLFTTKPKGMGFGLPISKRFTEAHGGSISAKSIPRKGTTFTVRLPIEPKIEKGGEEVWVKTLESSLLTTTKT